jgi:hypothetical protein
MKTVAIIRRRDAPIEVVFTLGPASPEKAAEAARRLGLIRAQLKIVGKVLVRPHVRRWPVRIERLRRVDRYR